jgi:hypothetical protein
VIEFDVDLAKKLARGTTRQVLDRAFRLRQGEIGALQSCLCDYPIKHHDTLSHHDERCPAHAIRMSMLVVEAAR